jgi:hypothetical protein
MNIVMNIIDNKKTYIFIWFISAILFAIIVWNSIYPKEIEFHNYYMIITHILALFIFLKILKIILAENWNTFKFIFLDSRTFFLIALMFLYYTPFYIILKDVKIAEQLSIYAYYFLVLWVIYEIILSKFENKVNSIKHIAISNMENLEKKKERLEKLEQKKKEKKNKKKI